MYISANPRKAHRKLKNWTIVKAIEEIANVQNLTLRLKKVKAHSGVIHNETADQLAREGCLKPNAETIEEPLRHFTKKLGTAKHSIKWKLLNRNISTISAFKSKQIQWESSWRTTMLSYIDRNVTDNKETRQRAFNVKLFNNELPTLEKLKDRFLKIYENDSCIQCNLKKEDQVHVLTCSKNLIDIHSCRNKLINMLVSKTTTVDCGNTCKNLCKTLETLKELHIPRDNAETIEEPLRHFTKKLGTAKHSIKWKLLNRNISTISAFKSKQIQWESSWRTTMLSYIDRNVTDNKETRQRAFNVKLFNNELPTLEKLKDRFLKIYENDSCIQCNLKKEDQVHVLTCSKNLIDIHSCRNKLINMLVSKTTTVDCGNTCKNLCKTLETLKELHIPRDVSTLILITVYDIILQKVVTHELADQIIDDVFTKFKLFLHTHIWKDRCTVVKKWEAENEISNNKWKKKVRNETLVTTVTSQINNTDNNSAFNSTTQDLYIIMLSKIVVIGLGCIK
ncbi:hypothetical protein Glove_464g55 [Diversispora epigaea]|uniref:RNase H type-1 domain-containing protein n=1 Tax=Diversispora epigaea TaxID=1348612 RepID=A0A397GVT3_9GLOM|nr:hypothetical protein Glove_464g55 [Diversispora epigaea]